MPSKLRKAFSSGMKESSSRKRMPKTDEAETVSTSGDESFSHLDSGSPARTGKFLMSPNPLALQVCLIACCRAWVLVHSGQCSRNQLGVVSLSSSSIATV